MICTLSKFAWEAGGEVSVRPLVSRDQSGRYLSKVAKAAIGRRPWAIGGFNAVVFSLGGLMEKETADEIEKWRKEMRDTVWAAIIKRVGLVLLRARAKVYEG